MIYILGVCIAANITTRRLRRKNERIETSPVVTGISIPIQRSQINGSVIAKVR